MTPSRLLVVTAVFACSACLFAQENQANASLLQGNALSPQKATIPMQVDPLGTAQAVPQDPLARLLSEDLQIKNLQIKNNDGKSPNVLLLPAPNDQRFVISPDSLPGDEVCLKIRSYLMKRDSKDSDSTHLAGYSTCQKAGKYQLRSVAEPADH